MTEKEQEHLAWMISAYATLLTGVIQNTTLTERTINSCIGLLLCKDANDSLSVIDYLINPLPFKNKTDLLKKLLMDKRRELNTKYSEVFKEMEELNRFRNTLAHSHLETRYDNIKKFDKNRIAYTNPTRPQVLYINIKEGDEKLERFRYINEQMFLLYKEIKEPALPSHLR